MAANPQPEPQWIALGKKSQWKRLVKPDPLTGAPTLNPFAQTLHKQILALFDEEENVLGALDDSCPHRGCSLATHGHRGECPGTIGCRHKRYLWDYHGAVVSVGGANLRVPCS
jgi:phenylpropionate dioxygenase-like ring-hydroxylating dioxygenase large terminal subunit